MMKSFNHTNLSIPATIMSKWVFPFLGVTCAAAFMWQGDLAGILIGLPVIFLSLLYFTAGRCEIKATVIIFRRFVKPVEIPRIDVVKVKRSLFPGLVYIKMRSQPFHLYCIKEISGGAFWGTDDGKRSSLEACPNETSEHINRVSWRDVLKLICAAGIGVVLGSILPVPEKPNSMRTISDLLFTGLWWVYRPLVLGVATLVLLGNVIRHRFRAPFSAIQLCGASGLVSQIIRELFR